MTKAVVAAIRTKPERVLQDVPRLMELGGLRETLDVSARTILKDNISWHLHFPAANTTPWQLEGTILGLHQAGYRDLVAVHNETVVTRSAVGERLNRLESVYRTYNIPHLRNFKSDEIHWERYHPKSPTPALERIYHRHLHIPREFIGTNIVHLPTIKCHIYTTTTGAMKNAFGGLLNSKRHYTHSVIHQTLVDLLRVQKEIHTGVFAVMDGTFAGDGPGPRTMRPHQKDIMLASGDQVAIDAVAAKLMGFDPLSIEYIRSAHDAGLGVGDPREIELVGDDVSQENWHFSVGDNLASRFGDLLWFSPLKTIQKFLFHTPLLNVFVLGSFLYHDYFWYPLFSGSARRLFSASEWGRMFEGRYSQNGSLNDLRVVGILENVNTHQSDRINVA